MSNGNLITNTPINYIAPKQCEFTINGQNLAAMRRAKLRQLAKSLGVSPDDSKQAILKRIIAKLKVTGAPKELSDI
ncbi:hypothetical protein LCGC14_1726560 [marine sediment metagenome]|uniref:SAP domain-containing protein n=1 Tax=marine sediment metagenome TaxID=412755 RepID=A0A0F9HAL8_9ZZZZ